MQRQQNKYVLLHEMFVVNGEWAVSSQYRRRVVASTSIFHVLKPDSGGTSHLNGMVIRPSRVNQPASLHLRVTSSFRFTILFVLFFKSHSLLIAFPDILRHLSPVGQVLLQAFILLVMLTIEMKFFLHVYFKCQCNPCMRACMHGL